MKTGLELQRLHVGQADSGLGSQPARPGCCPSFESQPECFLAAGQEDWAGELQLHCIWKNDTLPYPDLYWDIPG